MRYDLETTKKLWYGKPLLRWGLTKQAAILTCRQANKELRDNGNSTRWRLVESWPASFPEIDRIEAMPETSLPYIY